MSTRNTLLNRIDAYLAKTGMSERQFSMRVTADHKWLARLRRGQVSLASIERAETFMAAPTTNADAVVHAAAQGARREAKDIPNRHLESV